jgi:hypothetical protein
MKIVPVAKILPIAAPASPRSIGAVPIVSEINPTRAASRPPPPPPLAA